jgi:hypothetical protein
MVDDLRRLRADTESGKMRALPLADRLRERWSDLRRMAESNGAVTVAGLGLAALIVVLIAFDKISLGSLVLLGLVGLLVYRRIRNRRHRLVSKCVVRLRKRPDVRLIALAQDTLTVLVDEADATLYSEIHAIVDSINRRLYFGQPLGGAVRDDVAAGELAQILQRPGVLYVRADVAKLARSSSAPPPSQ